MKKLIFIICVVAASCAFAHSQEEELAVVRQMMLCIQLSPEWNDVVHVGPSTDRIEIAYANYDDLFVPPSSTNSPGSGWPLEDRRAAFENFIAAIPELSTNGVYKYIRGHSGIALSYCCKHSASNVLGSAIRILSSKHSYGQAGALEAFEKFARPTSEMNDFVSGLLTNENAIGTRERSDLLDAYMDILRVNRETCRPDVFSNGVSIVHRAVSGMDGSVALDQLLLSAYPGYAMSSNRFEIAMGTLQDQNEEHKKSCCIEWLQNYFAPITNQLLNAEQPLVQIEIP